MKSETIWTCEVRTTTLECGCLEIDQLETLNKPKHEWTREKPCEKCGKYHHPAGRMRYQNCEQHALFFQKWPGLDKCRCYISGHMPQMGVNHLDAFALLLERNDWPQDQKWELVKAIAKAGMDSIAYAAAADIKGLNQEMVDTLALIVRDPYYISSFLKNIQLGTNTTNRLRWILRWRQAILWTIRVLTIVLTIGAWLWHLPDWKTVLTLSITIAAAATFFSHLKELLLPTVPRFSDK